MFDVVATGWGARSSALFSEADRYSAVTSFTGEDGTSAAGQ